MNFKNCNGSALLYAILVPGLTTILILIFSHINQKNVDIVSTTVSSSKTASTDPSTPHCLFQCSEILRADSTWPTVTTVKTLCKKNMFCPDSHPISKKRHAHTSMSQENTTPKIHYIWVEEHLCCKK